MEITLLKAIVTGLTALIAMVQGHDARIAALEQGRVAMSQNLGAVAGSDSFFPVETHNGVAHYFFRGNLKAATSGPLSFKTPGASTTPQVIQCRGTSGVLTDEIVIAWGATQFATTTAIARYTPAATGQTPEVVATTTLTTAFGAGKDGVFPPNTWVNVRLGTSTALTSMTNSLAGVCTMELIGF